MKFPSPLLRGRLERRYKRFLADVTLDTGETVTATCPNTGSMMGLATPGAVVWLSESDSKTRKYRHTWEMVEAEAGKEPTLVGINTHHPNRLVTEAITTGKIKDLNGFASLRREVKYGKSSRIDILLEDEKKGLAYVEIKNVHLLRKPGRAEFPDSPTARGVKHLQELASMVRSGHRAVMLYLIQRADVRNFSLAGDIDPAYAHAFEEANAAGVEAIAYRCRLNPQEISLDKAVPIVR
jgi:sugar fermentation stimulation protein A